MKRLELRSSCGDTLCVEHKEDSIMFFTTIGPNGVEGQNAFHMNKSNIKKIAKFFSSLCGDKP